MPAAAEEGDASSAFFEKMDKKEKPTGRNAEQRRKSKTAAEARLFEAEMRVLRRVWAGLFRLLKAQLLLPKKAKKAKQKV